MPWPRGKEAGAARPEVGGDRNVGHRDESRVSRPTGRLAGSGAAPGFVRTGMDRRKEEESRVTE